MDAESLERPALDVTPDGDWDLYLSCATYGSKHWRIERLRARRPQDFSARTRTTIFPGSAAFAIKDWVLVRGEDLRICPPLASPGPADRGTRPESCGPWSSSASTPTMPAITKRRYGWPGRPDRSRPGSPAHRQLDDLGRRAPARHPGDPASAPRPTDPGHGRHGSMSSVAVAITQLPSVPHDHWPRCPGYGHRGLDHPGRRPVLTWRADRRAGDRFCGLECCRTCSSQAVTPAPSG